MKMKFTQKFLAPFCCLWRQDEANWQRPEIAATGFCGALPAESVKHVREFVYWVLFILSGGVKREGEGKTGHLFGLPMRRLSFESKF